MIESYIKNLLTLEPQDQVALMALGQLFILLIFIALLVIVSYLARRIIWDYTGATEIMIKKDNEIFKLKATLAKFDKSEK